MNKLSLVFAGAPGDIAPGDIPNNLTLHIGSTSLRLSDATSTALGDGYLWTNHGLTWSDNESIEVRISRPSTPNAYGYRTIWTALLTAEEVTGAIYFGYNHEGTNSFGKLTNNLIVTGRDETVTIGTPGQPPVPLDRV